MHVSDKFSGNARLGRPSRSAASFVQLVIFSDRGAWRGRCEAVMKLVRICVVNRGSRLSQ
jgi:hypothetical protein